MLQNKILHSTALRLLASHSRQVKHNFNVYETVNFLVHTLVEPAWLADRGI